MLDPHDYVDLITRDDLSDPNDILPGWWGVAICYPESDHWLLSYHTTISFEAFKEANAELFAKGRNYAIALVVPKLGDPDLDQ